MNKKNKAINLKSKITIINLLIIIIVNAQPVSRNIKTSEYKQLQSHLCSGWNTWYASSILTHVHLPDGFGISICFTDKGNSVVREYFMAPQKLQRPETVRFGLRSDDGSYTCITVNYKGAVIKVQSATIDDDLLILIEPDSKTNIKNHKLIVEPNILWNNLGVLGKIENHLVGNIGEKNFSIYTPDSVMTDGYILSNVPNLVFSLEKEISLSSGKYRSKEEIKRLIEEKRLKNEERFAQYGQLSEVFKAIQSVLVWNTIYDAPNHRAINPVTRLWCRDRSGFVLFNWDTYFAAYMFSLFNKELAYANAVEITKAISPAGFVPNTNMSYGVASLDRSQPPIGSFVINELYKRFHDKWLLEEVYDELFTWNSWWVDHRMNKGYLSWGSNPVTDPKNNYLNIANTLKGAKFESGLDNSPMYDQIPFDTQTHKMELADVGLMSLYVLDCNSLAEIAEVLGKKDNMRMLRKRAAHFSKLIQTLWDEDKGIYLNKRLDNNSFSERISPTCFYPMLAKVCTPRQAERLINEHYFNEKEFYGKFMIPSISKSDPSFNDNDYWRGRIWAPMNFLVYLGLRNYNLSTARKDIVDKSQKILIDSWLENGGIYENYNANTGRGDDVLNADPFHHWSALFGFISFIEYNK